MKPSDRIQSLVNSLSEDDLDIIAGLVEYLFLTRVQRHNLNVLTAQQKAPAADEATGTSEADEAVNGDGLDSARYGEHKA